jgi:hypothetical protein
MPDSRAMSSGDDAPPTFRSWRVGMQPACPPATSLLPITGLVLGASGSTRPDRRAGDRRPIRRPCHTVRHGRRIEVLAPTAPPLGTLAARCGQDAGHQHGQGDDDYQCLALAAAASPVTRTAAVVVGVARAAARVVMAASVGIAMPMTPTPVWSVAMPVSMTVAFAVAALGVHALAGLVACGGFGLWDL